VNGGSAYGTGASTNLAQGTYPEPWYFRFMMPIGPGND
jgi:hypothetical protein